MKQIVLAVFFVVLACVCFGSFALAQARGISPISAWDCPPTHPIKGNFTTSSGEPCIFHLPGGQFYSRTKPERCYRSIQDAILEGCRQSLR